MTVQQKKFPWKFLIAILVVAVLMIGLPVGFLLGWWVTNSNSQMVVWANIQEHENDLRNLYSNQTQTELRNWLPNGATMNFTDGLIWESHMLNFSYDRPAYQNAIQVLQNGKGACGEFAWVYGAFCVAANIPFRLVTVGYYVQGVVDHAWIQVNPSRDGSTWIQIEVAGSCDGLQKGGTINQLWNNTINNNQAYLKNDYKMVIAFQLNDYNEVTITDVTSTFSR